MKLSTAMLLLACASATMAFVPHATTQRSFRVDSNQRTNRSSSRFVAANPNNSEEQVQAQTHTQTDLETIHRDADVIFSIIDVDGSGSVSRQEMTDHLTTAGYAEGVIHKIFGMLDVNKDGAISREEFQRGLALSTHLRSAPGLGNDNAQFAQFRYHELFMKEIYEDADAVFQSADADGNGEIDASELKSHLRKRRRTFTNFSDKAIDNIFESLDVNGDGKISKKELRDAFVKYSALRQAIGERPNSK
jgi:Ca2+-binding EF-hand superfamily protein